MDILDYPEIIDEIIKYMDFMPEDEQARRNLVLAFVRKAICA